MFTFVLENGHIMEAAREANRIACVKMGPHRLNATRKHTTRTSLIRHYFADLHVYRILY